MKNLFLLVTLIGLVACSSTKDLGHSVQGDYVNRDVETLSTDEIDPFIASPAIARIDTSEEYLERKSESPYLHASIPDQNIEKLKTSEFKDIPFQMPGALNTSEYKELDVKAHAREFYNLGDQTVNLAYYKNGFDYTSPNDVINRTISNGFQHGRFGPLLIRNDQYVFKTLVLNGFYAIGAGVTFSRGKGVFSDDNSESSTTFKLWEIPADLGLGIEIPLGPWAKIQGVGGMSGVALYQSRDDYAEGENGKRRLQVGYGPFAEGSLRFNLSRIFPETAYDYFTSSELTNLTINASMRYQNYSNFKEDITISGTSVGLGFGFEFL